MSTQVKFFLGIVAVFLSLVARSRGVTVTVAQGRLLGETVDFVETKFVNISAKVNVFKGIPYAEKPVRFQPPVPKKSWTGVREALKFTVKCPQIEITDGETYVPQNEDCLHLNVFAPEQQQQVMEKLPVMVFIHGGGYIVGTSMIDRYSGVAQAAIGNVVVVTINYRLGVAGFLSTGDGASSGNFGLLDQVEALRWVQANIEEFGGDKSKVTIFGESAGAGSVDCHVISKYSRHLFHQAIEESGAAVTPWSYREDKERNKVKEAFRLGSELGCPRTDTHALVECLKQVDAVLLETYGALYQIARVPTIDGVFFEESPMTLIERGDIKNCPTMIGFNSDEGTLSILLAMPEYFISQTAPVIDKLKFNELLTSLLEANSEFVSELITDAIKQEYVDWSQWENDTFDYFRTIVDIMGDQEFSCPALRVARSHATMTSEPVYMYYMTHVTALSDFAVNGTGPGWMGAGHAEELQLVFGLYFLPEFSSTFGKVASEMDRELSVKFIRYWTNFAKTGDPSRSDPLTSPLEEDYWPPYTIPERRYKELAVDLNVRRGLKDNHCAFWNNFKPELQSYISDTSAYISTAHAISTSSMALGCFYFICIFIFIFGHF